MTRDGSSAPQWFKQRSVAGAKVDTIRKRQAGLTRPGERVALSVGPRPAFATAVITAVEAINDLPASRRRDLARIYGEGDRDMLRVSFRLDALGEEDRFPRAPRLDPLRSALAKLDPKTPPPTRGG